jgi:hypothetical protein
MKSRIVINLDDELKNGRPRRDAGATLQLSALINAGSGNTCCIARGGTQPSARATRRNAKNVLRCKILDTATTVRRGCKNDAELKRSTAVGIRDIKNQSMMKPVAEVKETLYLAKTDSTVGAAGFAKTKTAADGGGTERPSPPRTSGGPRPTCNSGHEHLDSELSDCKEGNSLDWKHGCECKAECSTADRPQRWR